MMKLWEELQYSHQNIKRANLQYLKLKFNLSFFRILRGNKKYWEPLQVTAGILYTYIGTMYMIMLRITIFSAFTRGGDFRFSAKSNDIITHARPRELHVIKRVQDTTYNINNDNVRHFLETRATRTRTNIKTAVARHRIYILLIHVDRIRILCATL